MLPDLHIHTQWSGHGVGDIEDMITAAIVKGCSILGISEHLPFTLPYELQQTTLHWSQEQLFRKKLTHIIQTNQSKIEILYGAECDYIPELKSDIQQYLDKARTWEHHLDYVIGSIHFVDVIPVAATDKPKVDNVAIFLHRYYQLLEEAINSKLFDIVGHLDIPKKHDFEQDFDLSKVKLRILDAIKDNRMAMELNTSGFDRNVKESFPNLAILKEANHREIPIVIGSDAHKPEHVCRHFDLATKMLYSAGYNEVTIFRGRESISIPLSEVA
jgi:histidinol-phosphatase (PHP family)